MERYDEKEFVDRFILEVETMAARDLFPLSPLFLLSFI